jgi:hypothetical protein
MIEIFDHKQPASVSADIDPAFSGSRTSTFIGRVTDMKIFHSGRVNLCENLFFPEFVFENAFSKRRPADIAGANK